MAAEKPETKKIGAAVPTALWERIRKTQISSGYTMAEFIQHFFEKYLTQEEKDLSESSN